MKETKVYRIPLFIEDVERIMEFQKACSPSEAIQKIVSKEIQGYDYVLQAAKNIDSGDIK